jgi:adenylate kinase
MRPMTVIFIGSQGIGKGTQVKLLHHYLESSNQDNKVIVHDTGESLRTLMAGEGYANTILHASMNRGEQQPDFLPIWSFSNDLIHKLEKNDHIIIDGFPRSLVQAQVMEAAFGYLEREKPVFLILKVHEEIAIERLLARGREDDTRESIAKRLRWSREIVEPAIDYFRKNEKYEIIEIDGEQPAETVHQNIINTLHLV